jgi:hypothetical protein
MTLLHPVTGLFNQLALLRTCGPVEVQYVQVESIASSFEIHVSNKTYPLKLALDPAFQVVVQKLFDDDVTASILTIPYYLPSRFSFTRVAAFYELVKDLTRRLRRSLSYLLNRLKLFAGFVGPLRVRILFQILPPILLGFIR